MLTQERFKRVKEILQQMQTLRTVKESAYVKGEIDQLSERLNDTTFRIAVVGEFSSGKSTFINALIGKDILSHARRETTAAITYIQNVRQDDKRCGSCVVEFRDGTTKILEHMEEISDYTTAQSQNRVAEQIRAVTLYVHFLGVETPIMVVDTPGLNGIAEHHREITLEEIKKAHTCIYLLSSSGISKSDVNFIRILTDYQNSFLFLQNFIDDLKEEEGDTLESKIAEDDEAVHDYLLSEGKTFQYKIIGISALKALASKDLSIKRLYANDLSKELKEDRTNLYEESRFSEFEHYLEQLIKTGEYRAVVVDSVMKRLSVILDGLRGQLDEEQKLNAALREQDQGNQRIQAAQDVLAQMQHTQEDREKRIRNFVRSNALKQRKLLETATAQKLDLLYQDICKDIDKEIPNYQTYLNFKSVHGKGASVYYSQKVAECIGKVASELMNTAELMLHHLYEETIARVETYTRRKNAPVTIRFSLDPLTDVFRMEDTKSLDMIQSLEHEIQALRENKKRLQDNLAQAEIIKRQTQKNVQSARDACDACKNRKDREMNSLGGRPEPKYWETYSTVSDPRDGLLGKIGDRLFGMRSKTITHQHSDDSEGIQWDSKRTSIQRRYRMEEQELADVLEEAQNKDECADWEICRIHTSLDRNTDDLESTKTELQQQKEIREQEIKLSQGKFCEQQKKQLKASIEERLVNEANPTSTRVYFKEYFHNLFERNEPMIEGKGVEAFHKGLAEQKLVYEKIIQQNKSELEQRYQSNEGEYSTLEALSNELAGMKA